MNISSKSILEFFPDEIILEICRYLHCGHVLYSFFGLNSRLNQSITNYYQHVILRRLNYTQFIYLYSNILPTIGPFIISLTINRLQQTYFLLKFSLYMNDIFPNIEKLALDDWKNEDLFQFIENYLNQLKYLRTIIIRGLRQRNNDHSIDVSHHLLQSIEKNTQIKYFYFEPDCYSMTLLKTESVSYTNIIEMRISLSTSNDLICLATLMPNIHRLHVIIEELLPIEQDIIPFQCLNEFSLDTMNCYSKFDCLLSILRLTPTIKQLSLTVTTNDDRLIYGQDLFTFLSSQSFNNNLIQSFKYAVYLTAPSDYYLDSLNLQQSWKPLPIAYSINKDDRKSYILVHTLPYPSILLNLDSTLTNRFGVNIRDKLYDNIQYLCMCHVKTLMETFTIIQHCRKIQDLTIQIDKYKTTSTVSPAKQPIPILPKLNRLQILSIFGVIDNWEHLKSLFIASHNLSTLCIDLDCVIQLFEIISEDEILPRILHLFIDGERSNIKLTNKYIHRLAKVFSGIHSLKIKYKSEDLIEANIVASIIDHCKHLIVFTINGQISDDISSEHLQEWLMEYSIRLRNSETNYKIEFIDDWFQVWL